jgi:hypothetical protein
VGGVGIAAVAGGLLWYFLSPSEEPAPGDPAAAFSLQPVVGPWMSGLSLTGSF